MQRRTALATLAATLAAPVPALARTWPSKPVRLVVGFSAGGAIDEMARTLGDSLSRTLGQPVVIENKPGAASTLAAEFVASAPPDGHVLLMGGTSMIIARHLQNRASVDISRFTPIAGVAGSPLVIVVNPAFPAQDPQGFIRELNAQPGKYFYATSGVGSLHHMGMEMLKKQLGLKLEHVPYKGASAILPDLMSGQISIAVISANAAAEQDKAGKLRVIGLMNPGQYATEPHWRSISEVAPGFGVMPRMFLLGPQGIPADIVAQIEAGTAQALKSPELLKSFGSQGAMPQHASAAALRAEVQRENETWGQVVKSLNLKAS